MRNSIDVAQVRRAHPGLDQETAERIAEAYGSVAEEYGVSVAELAIESRQAERSSLELGDAVA